jgi:hypothetical protein
MQSPLEKPRWTIKIKILVKLLLLKVEMLSLSTIAPPPQTLLGTAVSSTNKHKCHNITEILLKVALTTITLTLYSLQMIVMYMIFQMKNLSSPQKAELMKLMNEAVQLLRPMSSEDTDYPEMTSNVTNFRKILSQFKPEDKDAKNVSIQKWQTNGKVMCLYKVC